MSIPANMLTTTCDVYRPFGDASATTTGIACRLAPDLSVQQGAAIGALNWTHYIDVDYSVDIRDGCSRSSGANAITYADGDEVRVPDASGSRFVVVWVEIHNLGTARQFKRVYLLRHSA